MNKFHIRRGTSCNSTEIICIKESFLLCWLRGLLADFLAESPLKYVGGIPDLLLDNGGDVGDWAPPHAPHLGHLEPSLVWLTAIRHSPNTNEQSYKIIKIFL